LLKYLKEGNLDKYVTGNGGASDILYHGKKLAKKVTFSSLFGERGYRFSLVPMPNDLFDLQDEVLFGTEERGLNVHNTIPSLQIYHFHDSSSSSPMRFPEIVEDCVRLRENASNIGPVLLYIRNNAPDFYKEIVDTVRLVMPFFDDFILEPKTVGPKTVVDISWHQKGSVYPMLPYTFSDGLLRFICLVTALLQPSHPTTIIVDEPELGLCPASISLIAELVKSVSKRTQVIAATQSPGFINQFDCEDLIVVDRKDGASSFRRLQEKDFSAWLEDYSLGELWEKDVLFSGQQPD
jgi:predicted ATPase